MPRSLPSTAALQAFESAAHHGSITRAAAELHLTQSAVSRQIQTLERSLGLALFERRRQRIHLTPAGEVYLDHLRGAFDRLEAGALALRAMRSGDGGGVLHLAILPTFGTRWLIPRFPAFAKAHPAIQVNFSTRLFAFDFAAEDLDAAIHYGEGHWPGAALDHLMDEEVVVVCSAGYRLDRELATIDDLPAQTLLHVSTRSHGWDDWLQAKGIVGVDGRRGPRFEYHAMVLEAAIAGLGIAVLPSFVVDEELRTGRVVEAFPDTRVRTGKAYWLACPARRRELPALVAFREWLLAAMRSADPEGS